MAGPISVLEIGRCLGRIDQAETFAAAKDAGVKSKIVELVWEPARHSLAFLNSSGL